MAVTFSQGLMIPWMAALGTHQMTPMMNSLSTSDTYLGLLVAMTFVGMLARRIGLRNLVLWALASGITIIFLFTVISNIQWWILLRFVFGLSLGGIHFGTQAWIGRLTTHHFRGRQMALYGLATGVGFALGPMFLATGKVAPWLPFGLAALAFAVSLTFLSVFSQEDSHSRFEAVASGDKRLSPNHSLLRRPVSATSSSPLSERLTVSKIYRVALPALLLPLAFGFMESVLNGDLPLFAVQTHMSLSAVSASLAAFVVGSLVFQLPLGHLSDVWGRRRVLTVCTGAGVILFALLPFAAVSDILFVALCFVVGAFLDTLFSLSLGYLADLAGSANLPTANQLAVSNLGLGLMVGPLLGGLSMKWLGPSGMFWSIACFYLAYVVVTFIWTPVPQGSAEAHVQTSGQSDPVPECGKFK